MPNYFYTDENGNRRGPVDTKQLNTLAAQGVITPTTPIEIERGPKGVAGQIPGLFSPREHKPPVVLDIGFTRFITNTWTTILWVLTIIIAFIGCVGGLVYAANYDAPGLFILAPIAAALFLLFMRIFFEAIIVLFRIETHLRTIREKYENT